MNHTEDRRLIEDYLPIKAISAEASRERILRTLPREAGLGKGSADLVRTLNEKRSFAARVRALRLRILGKKDAHK